MSAQPLIPPSSQQVPADGSQINKHITQTFTLKYFSPNQKLYISYRRAFSKSAAFMRYEMNSEDDIYQRELTLERNQTYDYYYSVEINGEEQKETGTRQYRYDEKICFEMDEWNTRWIHYQIETQNDTLFNKVYIEISGYGFKLRLKKDDSNRYSALEKISLKQLNLTRSFSFVMQDSFEEPYQCIQLKVFENKVIKMNKIFVNFDSSHLIPQTLNQPLKDYILQSMEIKNQIVDEGESTENIKMLQDLQNKLQQAKEDLKQRQSGLEEEKNKFQRSLNQYQLINEEFQQAQLVRQNSTLKQLTQTLTEKTQLQFYISKYEQLQLEHQQSQEQFEELAQLKERELASEKNKSQQNLEKFIQKNLEYNQILKKHYETIQQKEGELQTLKNQNQLYLDQYEQIRQECQKAINNNEQLTRQHQEQYENLRETKQNELKIYKEKALNEMDQLRTKLDCAYMQLKDLQEALHRHGISENQIPSICQDVFQNLPEKEKQDLMETLQRYEDKMKIMKKMQADSNEQIQYQDEKMLELAMEKKRIYEDFTETVAELESKVCKLQIENTDANDQLSSQGIQLKQLKNQLAFQKKELKAFEMNYETFVNQLEEQIRMNQELKEKSARDQAEFSEKEKLIKFELQQQENYFLESKSQLEQLSKEQSEKLERQQREIEQQQQLLKIQAEFDVYEQQRNIQAKEQEIIYLRQQLQEQLESQQENYQKYQEEILQLKRTYVKQAAQDVARQQQIIIEREKEVEYLRLKIRELIERQKGFEVKKEEIVRQQQEALITQAAQDFAKQQQIITEKEKEIAYLRYQLKDQVEQQKEFTQQQIDEMKYQITTQNNQSLQEMITEKEQEVVYLKQQINDLLVYQEVQNKTHLEDIQQRELQFQEATSKITQQIQAISEQDQEIKNLQQSMNDQLIEQEQKQKKLQTEMEQQLCEQKQMAEQERAQLQKVILNQHIFIQFQEFMKQINDLHQNSTKCKRMEDVEELVKQEFNDYETQCKSLNEEEDIKNEEEVKMFLDKLPILRK